MAPVRQAVVRRSGQKRILLRQRLQARRPEIEQAILTRAYAIGDPSDATDPAYLDGLRGAVSAALDYGLTGIEASGNQRPPVPAPLFAQARLAARSRISLDTVLRRYFAGYSFLSDFLIEEAEGVCGIDRQILKQVLRSQSTLFDRLLVVVTETYSAERAAQPDSTKRRRIERIESLLAGELLDTADLDYEFDAFHIGVIAAGDRGGEAIRALAKTLDRLPLLVIREQEDMVWAWLGGMRPVDPAELQRLEPMKLFERTSIAIGEQAHGLGGWRLTHRQARAALPIALRSEQWLVRYADVALIASILSDETLTSSLHALYLMPLSQCRDGGLAWRETLRAYFAADRNVSSAAAAVGVSRQTVINRLRGIEERLGRPLGSWATDMEIALRLEAHVGPSPSQLVSAP